MSARVRTRLPDASALSASSELDGLLALLRREPSMIAGALVFLGAVAFTAWRLQRGVELTDESFYVALPLRFALGDRPFLDERTSLQGAGLIELPIVWLYHLFVRSNSGLVLFMRLSYLGFLTGIGLALASAVRGWISRGSALACGGVACFFVPYCLFQFSYNTLGGGLAMLAGITVLRLSRSDGLSERSARRYAVLAGVCVASAILAYPTLMPLAMVHAITIVAFGRKTLGWWKTLLWYAAGGGIIVLYVGLFLLRSGFGALGLTLEFVRAYGPTLTGSDWPSMMATVEHFKNDWVHAFVIAGGLALVARRYRLFVFLLAIYVPTLALPTESTGLFASVRYFSCLALFAPLFGLLVEDRRRAFTVLATLWIPAVLTGVLTGISSSMSGKATGLGAFAGVLAGAVLACRACEEAWGSFKRWFAWSSIVAPVALIWVFGKIALSDGAVYRDGALDTLVATVHVGPFKGVKTTPDHRRVVEQMHTDVVTHVNGSRYGLFFPDMPSAYLSANVRAAAAELWIFPVAGRQAIDAAIFREKAHEVGIVGMRACGPDPWRHCAPQLRKDDPIARTVLETHDVVLKRDDYWILKPR